MSRSALLIWMIAIGLSAAAIIPSGSRAARAKAKLDHASKAHAQVAASATEHRSLLAALPDWATRVPASTHAEGKDNALATRISSTLAAAGLAPSALTAFQADSAAPIAQSQLAAVERTRAVITLDGPTLPQLGAFLTAWCTREPDHVITAIDLSPQPAPARASKSPSSTTGGDAPLHAVITIETQHLTSKSKEFVP